MKRVPSFGSQIASSLKPILRGKIEVYSTGYVFGEEGYTNPNGVHLKAFLDDNGRSVQLAKVRQAPCPLPSNRSKGYPVVRNRSFVPIKTCKACEHRLEGGCCAILRRQARESLRPGRNDEDE